MGFINNPLPSSMSSECKKCGSILTQFVDPKQAFGPNKVIPPEILQKAKGLAIVTVFKIGFLGSARFGSGIIVARKADGNWSAPSAIGTVGGGFGGQIGLEMTDFVFILNDSSAVKTFTSAGSITIGGNISIAAGPVGRNAEAAGAASTKSVSTIFAYSNTKGLFAGVSLEGSGFIERKDANEKMYGRKVSAGELLRGDVPVPPQADPLMRILNSRVFAGRGGGDMHNNAPVYSTDHDDVVWQGNRGSAYGEGVRSDRTGAAAGAAANEDYVYSDQPQRTNTWNDDVYDRAPAPAPPGLKTNNTFGRLEAARERGSTFGDQSDYTYSDRKSAPPAPPAKPKFAQKTATTPGQAVAKFAFDAAQPGDLGFKKGDVITIVKKTDKGEDWWTGRIDGREGIFPSNYVELV